MQDLRISLITNSGERNVKCQNCTINNISSFDHILPKNEFPEFTIHPKNLMCCCNDCNSRRSSIWRQEGKRTTLNLYTDKLPNTQYLFVKITYNGHELDTNFYLDPKNGIEKNLFALLRQHYDRLDLYRRFSDSADTIITSFRSLLSSMPLNKDTIENIIKPFLEKEKASFGCNYWQAILKLELLKNEQFMFELGYVLP